MKKTTILVIAILLALSSFCQEFIEFKPSDNTDVKCNVLTSENTIVEFEAILPGIYSTELDTFNRAEIKGHTRMDSVGFPEVPVLSFLVAIPECENVNIEVELTDSVKIENINIYPAPQIIEDTTESGEIYLKEEFAYFETAYSENSFFPDILAEILEKGAVRSQHCVRVFLYPVQFNPVLNEIIAYSKMKVTLTFDNPSGPVNINVGIFNEMLGNTMVNYISNGLNASASCRRGIEEAGSWQWITEFSEGDFVEEPCDYLIVTHESFYQNNDIESLAQHRADFNGFDVVVLKVEDIYTQISGEDYSERIRNLIQNTYNLGIANHTFDGKLAYVNLFGDAYFDDGTECIPTYPYYEPKGYDIYFTQLTQEGSTYDDYPDIMIGRCSADDEEQVHNVVTKILNFEPETMAGNDRILFAFGDEYGYYSRYSEMLYYLDNISMLGNYDKNIMLPDDYTNGYPEWNDPLPFEESTIPADYSNGLMFLSYSGHGGQLGWGIGDGGVTFGFNYNDMDPLLHSGTTPFILSNACNTGAFQLIGTYEDCMAERFLCYDENMGSIGFWGATEPTSPSALIVYLTIFHMC